MFCVNKFIIFIVFKNFTFLLVEDNILHLGADFGYVFDYVFTSTCNSAELFFSKRSLPMPDIIIIAWYS